MDSLIRYGFDNLYPKLKWLDKFTALEVACSLKVDYTEKLLDKVACDVIFNEYEDIARNLTLFNVIQAMGIYH